MTNKSEYSSVKALLVALKRHLSVIRPYIACKLLSANAPRYPGRIRRNFKVKFIPYLIVESVRAAAAATDVFFVSDFFDRVDVI